MLFLFWMPEGTHQFRLFRQDYKEITPLATFLLFCNYDDVTTFLGAAMRNLQEWLTLAAARCKSGDYGGAIKDYDQALLLDPLSAHAHCQRGNAYAHLRDAQQALVDYDHAIRLDAGFAEAYSSRADLRSRMGGVREALEDYTRVVFLCPKDPCAWSKQGNAFFRMGRHREALASYDEALRLEPVCAEVYSNRGLTRHRLGDQVGAAEDFATAARLFAQKGQLTLHKRAQNNLHIVLRQVG